MTFQPISNSRQDERWKPVARIVLPLRLPSWNQIKNRHWRSIKKIDDKLHAITSMCIQEQFDSETGITTISSPSKTLSHEAESFGKTMTRLNSQGTLRRKRSSTTRKKKPS